MPGHLPAGESADGRGPDREWSPDLKGWFSGAPYVQQINAVDLVTNRVLTVRVMRL